MVDRLIGLNELESKRLGECQSCFKEEVVWPITIWFSFNKESLYLDKSSRCHYKQQRCFQFLFIPKGGLRVPRSEKSNLRCHTGQRFSLYTRLKATLLLIVSVVR